MAEKIHTIIDKVIFNAPSAPTFDNVSFEPTLINFLYGKNGCGKTTISKLIGTAPGTKWQPGINSSDYTVMVYNEQYIENNIQSYGNIPGVFTITQENAKAKAGIDKAEKEKAAIQKLIEKASAEQEAAQKKATRIENKYIKDIWDKTEYYRDNYSEAIQYTRIKSKFIANIEAATPVEHDEKEMELLYATAYKGNAVKYERFSPIDSEHIPTSPLLEEQIIASSSTPFAEFMRALNASSWVRDGHQMFQHKAGEKCPYCQQKLPDNFEEDLAASYDDLFKEKIAKLNEFRQVYKDVLTNTYNVLVRNAKLGFQHELMKSYSTNIELFVALVKKNLGIIDAKIKEPENPVILDDLQPVLSELNKIIDEINQAIDTNNKVFLDLNGQKNRCSTMLLEHMAFLCQTIIAVHKSEKPAAEDVVNKYAEEGKKYLEESGLLDIKISELNTETVNTDKAKDSINDLIKASGFQGFKLRKKRNTEYVYELVREDATGKESVITGKAMSEGERHFIAFLYFYHEVMGSQSDKGVQTKKIVVIDDPVSSMDSSAMFIIAALTRNMIEVCYNNYALSSKDNRDTHIKQFFCMTHNPYFFREVTYNKIQDYECVSLFEIKKYPGNKSDIVICEKPSPGVSRGKINCSPVKNTYDALWEEYNTTDDPVLLMNIIRQILEYYFLQICGFKNGNLRSELLDKHKKDFDDGTPQQFEYAIASAMINLVNTGVAGFADGLYFDASAVSVEQLRMVFRKFFEVTHQTQHFDMKSGTKIVDKS